MENLNSDIQYFETISSTQEKAKELVAEGAAGWQVIAAEEQTSGYGRKKERWFSPKGGLYFSVIMPKSNIDDLQTLTIMASFIVAKVIKENFKLEPVIKPPNDVLINMKKVAGVITENVIGNDIKLSIMGIGINTNIDKFPKELENIATSLRIELGEKVDPVRDSEGKKKTQRKQISNGVDNNKMLKQVISGLKEQFRTISE